MFVKRLLPVALAAACLTSPAFAQEKLHWITLGDAALQQLQKIAPKQQVRRSAQILPGAGLAAVEKVHLTQISESQLQELSDLIHKDLKRCGGFILHDSESQGLAALQGPRKTLLAAGRPSYMVAQQAVVKQVLPELQASNIAQTIIDLSNFTNRYYQTQSGVAASNWLLQKWQTMAAGRSDITVEQFNHSWLQKSVILTIKGTDNASEVVVMGAHLDSIVQGGVNETTRAPGADDDASGVASLTEALRAMLVKNYKPRRTIKLMAYAAEEVGLRGSQEIATKFANENVNVVGVLQLDMTNYKGGANDIYLYTDYTDNLQTNFLANLISAYLPGIKIGYDKCGYGCSDHASWYAKGYVTSMPFEAPMNSYNPNIHTANDTFANSGGQAEHALKFAKLAAAYAVELGSQGATAPSGDRTETFSGSLARNETKFFGPFRAQGGNQVRVSTSGTGDLDLYVRKGAPASISVYDCKSDGSNSTEACNLLETSPTDVYVMINGYRSSTYTLNVTYKPM
ncbi:M20/M25/M40 family metallo-hydrolase [Massilia sp. W12]|uniref:M20/M25/M40 family metallo-hydrolase n=1 Tax=Massilia sp. W12 TaxID=3126507 RepID=UPI0030CF692F